MYLVAFLFVPTPLLGLQESGMSRTDGEATRADPATTLYYTERILLQCYSILSVSCYCTILYRYWADPAKMLYYTDTERILLQCYTIPIPSGSCCYTILYCVDPATVLYYTGRILLQYYTIPSGSCCTLESQKFLLPPPGFNQRSPHAWPPYPILFFRKNIRSKRTLRCYLILLH